VAYEAESGRLAVAGRSVVWVGSADGRLAPVHRARGVRDLEFGGDGCLWIAGDGGLERWSEAGTQEELLRGAGAAAVSRIRVAGGTWLAAASDGLYRRQAEGAWVRLDLPFPAGPVTALAAAVAPVGLRVGAVIAGVAHWALIAPAAGGASGQGLSVRDWQRIGSSGSGPRSASDVWLSPDGREAWTLLRDGCLVGSERVCIPLAPGARAERIFHVDGRWWITSPRGLLAASAAVGPWHPVAPPLGSLEVHAVAGGGGRRFVGTERGLVVSESRPAGGSGRDAPASPSAPAAPAGTEARSPRPGFAAASRVGSLADLPAARLRERSDPPIDAVRRAALSYLDLGEARLRAMRLGVARRGWLPTVALRLDGDRGRSRRDDFDQSFVSGGLRSLFDRQDDRSDGFEASLALEWDLGDVLHHPDSVDVSREARQLIELRDDVLDEIHHLYFERRRVLLELLALPPGRPLDAARLRLRADELAAGIDAWTGGWFGRHALQLAP